MVKNFLESLGLIEKKLNYVFKEKDLLFQAFTHSSFLNESTLPLRSNERLEFLGDAVLNLFISEFLFREFPQKEEGELSKLKAYLVSQKTCCTMVQMLNVTESLLVGRGGISAAIPIGRTVAGDLFESIVGAIFLDGGYASATSFLHQQFSSFLREQATILPVNPKAALQEWLAKKGKPLPEYEVIEMKGPSHQKEFTVAVCVAGARYGIGTGRTKKEAQQKAAELTLEALTKEDS